MLIFLALQFGEREGFSSQAPLDWIFCLNVDAFKLYNILSKYLIGKRVFFINTLEHILNIMQLSYVAQSSVWLGYVLNCVSPKFICCSPNPQYLNVTLFGNRVDT